MRQSKLRLIGMILIAMGLPWEAKAGECNLQVPFGPVNFEKEQPVAALRKILAGTGISLVEFGELSGVRITANNVAGTVDEVVRRLAEGTGLQYTCHNGVMRVGQPLSTMVSSGLPVSISDTRALNTKTMFIQLQKGDNLKIRLMAFAQRYHCVVHWKGDDLLAQQDGLFTGDSVEAVVSAFLLAAKMHTEHDE